jgi:DNA-binding GntR family transcriptional regulator
MRQLRDRGEQSIVTPLETTSPPDCEPEAVRSSDRVTSSIRALILSGECPPGSRIAQEDLAVRFGVSRLPVREALNRLESEGLVVLKPNSGAWVAKLDLAECLEVYKIRERIEPLALRESAERMTEQQVSRLDELVAEMSRTEDTETFLRLDRQFHLASYQPAGMNQLFVMIERFWNSTQHYRRAFTQLLGRDRSWIIHAEHRLIIDALRRRDCEGAAHLLYEHIRRTRFELASHEDIFAPSVKTTPKRTQSKAR